MTDKIERGAISDCLQALGGLFAAKQPQPLPRTVAVTPSLVNCASAANAPPSTLDEHWAVMRSQGFTAAQLIEFLQPHADLEGICVSYVYEDDSGHAQVYNHRHTDTSFENPLSRAIKNKRLSKERALQFALDDHGRTWIESNFVDLK